MPINLKATQELQDYLGTKSGLTRIQLRIETEMGEFSRILKNDINPERPRAKRERGYRRKHATEILKDIYSPQTFRNIPKPMSGKTKEEMWLLHVCDDPFFITGNRYRVLVAIARDLRLYPAPKWWRVYLRLNKMSVSSKGKA